MPTTLEIHVIEQAQRSDSSRPVNAQSCAVTAFYAGHVVDAAADSIAQMITWEHLSKIPADQL
jgi:hypothetical protein